MHNKGSLQEQRVKGNAERWAARVNKTVEGKCMCENVCGKMTP